MESPEDIEKALARLMPSAISDSGLRGMEETIDRLAAGETVDPGETGATPAPRRGWFWPGAVGAAAAAVAAAFLIPSAATVAKSDAKPAAPTAVVAPAEAGLVLVGQSEVVEEAVAEDWVSEADGVAHRAWRVRVLDRERLRDTRTGYEVTVTHPREEVRLMPVNTF